MTSLEIALVTMVSVWTILFCLLGVAGFFLTRGVYRILARVDGFLESIQTSSSEARAQIEALVLAIRDAFSSRPKSATVPTVPDAPSPSP